MVKVIDSVVTGYETVADQVRAILRNRRAHWRWFDHMARAFERYQEQRGDRLAAGLSFYGFLSFFPLTALAFALVGYAVAIDRNARSYVEDALDEVLGALANQLPVERIASAREGASVIALAILLWSGLGWVSALREALRSIWGVNPAGGGNFFVKKFWDVIVLITLGAALLVSVVVSSFATSATSVMLRWLGLAHVTGAGSLVRLASLTIALSTDIVIFFVMFSRLSGTRAKWRRLFKGAVFGAVGLEVFKLVGTFLIGHTTTNPIYASFAVLIGLLVWINLASRFLLFAAAWTATRSKVMAADDAPPAPESPSARTAAIAAGTAGALPAPQKPAEPPDGNGAEPASTAEATQPIRSS